jgi:hypothetical protein
VTRDGGVNWTQVNRNMPGAPEKWWISRVLASHHAEGTAYVCITGYREDDFRPFVYKTVDFGATWTLISAGLPNEPVAVIREDRRNGDLLVVGTELGCHLSLDGGNSWSRLSAGLPTVAVQDLVIQDATGDLVLGTHGRGIFIANIEPLRQLAANVVEKDAHLFRPAPALAFNFIPNMFDAFNGNRRYTAANPAFGASVCYFLKSASAEVTLEIVDVLGNVVRTINGSGEVGMNTVAWDLRSQGGQQAPGRSDGDGSLDAGELGDTQGGGGGQGRGPVVPAGEYSVRLKIGGTVAATAPLRVIDWIR